MCVSDTPRERYFRRYIHHVVLTESFFYSPLVQFRHDEINYWNFLRFRAEKRSNPIKGKIQQQVWEVWHSSKS